MVLQPIVDVLVIHKNIAEKYCMKVPRFSILIRRSVFYPFSPWMVCFSLSEAEIVRNVERCQRPNATHCDMTVWLPSKKYDGYTASASISCDHVPSLIPSSKNMTLYTSTICGFSSQCYV